MACNTSPKRHYNSINDVYDSLKHKESSPYTYLQFKLRSERYLNELIGTSARHAIVLLSRMQNTERIR